PKISGERCSQRASRPRSQTPWTSSSASAARAWSRRSTSVPTRSSAWTPPSSRTLPGGTRRSSAARVPRPRLMAGLPMTAGVPYPRDGVAEPEVAGSLMGQRATSGRQDVRRVSAPEHLSVLASGLRFGALAWGDPGAPLALLVHGYPDTAWTWRHLGPHPAERGWRAAAPLTPRHSPTDLAPDDRYLIADQVADVLALCSALGGDERAVLIGHDWGAAAVWGVTAREPQRFARYVAIAVPPPPVLLKPFGSLRTLGI